MISPSWDPDFAQSPMHGEEAQRHAWRQALSFCHERRLAIDVGAHIGLWTRLLANSFENVVAFEPVEENFDCLMKNVQESNVNAYRIAIGSERGSCEMIMPESRDNSGCWFAKPGQGTIQSTLDLFEYSVIDDSLPVDLIKIDVEGQEGAVLYGAREILKRDQPVVIFEDKGLGLANIGHSWLNPKTLLGLAGYKCRMRLRRDEIWSA